MRDAGTSDRSPTAALASNLCFSKLLMSGEAFFELRMYSTQQISAALSMRGTAGMFWHALRCSFRCFHWQVGPCPPCGITLGFRGEPASLLAHCLVGVVGVQERRPQVPAECSKFLLSNAAKVHFRLSGESLAIVGNELLTAHPRHTTTTITSATAEVTDTLVQ